MVPPVTEDDTMPVELPLQPVLAVTDAVAVIVAGWVMFMDEVEEHPLASFTMRV